MKDLTPAERAELYHKAFPNFPPLRADGRWIDGMWVLGNNYRGSGYYGSYPPQYLRRVMALFPDAERILHLFSGSLPPGAYVRFDARGGDVTGDAEQLSVHFHDRFDLILADPPYTAEDANYYGLPMVNRTKVLRECEAVLEHGGYIVWLDQVLPMFTKNQLHLCGLIGIVRSTNHRFRVASMFKKITQRR